MKPYLIGLLTIFQVSAHSQTNLPDNFKIGDYIEVYNRDSIKIYFSCTGTVIDKKCASYYRKGKMDKTIVNVVGNFHDYYMDDKVYLDAEMFNNNLEGAAHYYYPNGRVKEEGSYQNNTRQGKWTFYYPNGQVKKVYQYFNGEPLVLEAYHPNGKVTVVNGNGSFETEFSTYLQCDFYEASGELLNGKKNGKWRFSNPNLPLPIATEIYENGEFIKGNSKDYEYTKTPRIMLTNFCANENLNLLDNFLGCPGDVLSMWTYKNDDIHSSFFPELQQKLTEYKDSLQDQWLVVGISINKKNKIEEINVASSINDTNLENQIYKFLMQMTHWQTAVVNSSKVKSDIFFSILAYNNQIVISTDYIYHQIGN
jgi:antitoxin component YwqK of YwqJK toxin-antitoxin module